MHPPDSVAVVRLIERGCQANCGVPSHGHKFRRDLTRLISSAVDVTVAELFAVRELFVTSLTEVNCINRPKTP